MKWGRSASSFQSHCVIPNRPVFDGGWAQIGHRRSSTRSGAPAPSHVANAARYSEVPDATEIVEVGTMVTLKLSLGNGQVALQRPNIRVSNPQFADLI